MSGDSSAISFHNRSHAPADTMAATHFYPARLHTRRIGWSSRKTGMYFQVGEQWLCLLLGRSLAETARTIRSTLRAPHSGSIDYASRYHRQSPVKPYTQHRFLCYIARRQLHGASGARTGRVKVLSGKFGAVQCPDKYLRRICISMTKAEARFSRKQCTWNRNRMRVSCPLKVIHTSASCNQSRGCKPDIRTDSITLGCCRNCQPIGNFEHSISARI